MDHRYVPGSLRIARIAGIEIRIHFTWLIVFVLITLSLAGGILPTSWSEPKQLAVAAIAALLFFASVVVHELAHSLVARRFGMSVTSVTLFLLGGVANLEQEPPTARAELSMAAAGPLTSFALAGLTYLAELAGNSLLDAETMSTIAPVTGYLVTVNIAVGIFNLAPGFPLDGGRVLRAIIWGFRGDRAAATRIAAAGGRIVAIGIGLLGGLLLVIGEVAGLWYLIVAYFLHDMASTSLAQDRLLAAAAGVRVSQLMMTSFPAAPRGTTVAAIVRDVFLPSNARAVMIVDEGRAVGILDVDALRGVSHESWPLILVDEVMTPIARVATFSPQDELVAAIERFHGASLLPVVSEGALVGVLYPDTVGAYLRTREALDVVRAAPRSA